MLTSVSLRALINVRIALSAVIVIFLGGIIAVWQARTSVNEEVTASFNLAAEMIESGWQRPELARQWQNIFLALQHARHINVSHIGADGVKTQLIDESGKEVKIDSAPTWFAKLVKSPTLTSEYSVVLENGSLEKIYITSDPKDEIAEAWAESQAYFVSIVGMMLLILLMINVVFHSAFKAVSQILHVLRQVQAGHYNTALPVFKISEFDAIAEEINYLSGVLSEAHENNKALARHTIQIQEKERQTLSRELHDEMGQSLTAIKAMSVALKQPKSEVTTIAGNIIDICNHLSTVVRSMMRSLHPLSLTELGLGLTLKDMIDEWLRRYPVLDIQLNYDEELESVKDELTIHIYRIIQECLTNVVRHADAEHVTIDLKRQKRQQQEFAFVSVADDGKGNSAEGEGFGVRSMRERVESMHGEFSYTFLPGNGVTVTATMPLN